MLFSVSVIQGTLRCLLFFLFLPLNSQATWVVFPESQKMMNSTNNPQVPRASAVYLLKRFLL